MKDVEMSVSEALSTTAGSVAVVNTLQRQTKLNNEALAEIIVDTASRG